jgi:Ca2+-transporting ATPase
LITVVLIVLATRVDFLQHSLLTQPLTGSQWLACLGLALVLPTVIEVGKWIRRSRRPQPPVDPERAVAPQRGRTATAPAGRPAA